LSAAVSVPEVSSARIQPLPSGSTGGGAVVYGVAALLLFCPLAFGAVEPWAILVLEFVSMVLFGLWAVPILRSSHVQLHWNPLFTPSLAFAGIITVQMLTGATAYRNVTWTEFLLYGAYGIMCFLIVQCLSRTQQIRRIATALGLYGSAVAIFALLQNLSSPDKLYWFRTPRSGGWIYGPYVNHNHYAGLIEMLFPIPLVFAFTRFAHGWERWLAAGAASLMGATIFLSNSRGGMIAFAAEIAIFFCFLFKHRTRRQAGLVMAGLLVASLLFVVWLGWSQVAERVSTITNQHSEITADIRLKIDRDTLRMFLKRPLLGWGLGTFGEIYPQFQSFYTNSIVDYAHNDYLQLLAETGVVGFAVAIWFLVAALRPAARKLAKWPSDLNGAVALASTLGISGILVHSLVDFNLHIPANAALFYMLCTVASLEPRFATYRRSHRDKTDVADS
jgi:O-antigen ligase